MAAHARPTGEPEPLQPQRRRREVLESERPTPARRPRRRRQSTPWLQRNALGVAAISILIAFLGLGFGLAQMISRPDAPAGALTLAQTDLYRPSNPATQPSDATVMSAAAVSPGVQIAGVQVAGPAESASGGAARQIQSNARVLDANYTIAAGDTLVKIAQRFNTTVERVQAFNDQIDARALRIGTRLIIPPPL